ncbi:TPM domain-containing protein [Pseudomonas sp. X10]
MRVPRRRQQPARRGAAERDHPGAGPGHGRNGSAWALSANAFLDQLFRAWKLGRQTVDDGILLLVAKNGRKVHIEVGIGLFAVRSRLQRTRGPRLSIL